MSRLLDLIGQRFGRLTVISRAETHIKKNGSKETRWNCMCDCGNTYTMSSYGLRHNKRPSCGCAERESKKIRYRNNDIGKRFGRLTIEDILWDANPIKAICTCDCGNTYIGTKSEITSLHTQSCGCLQRELTSDANTKNWAGATSIYGVKFIKQQYMDKRGRWMWLCQCGICGNYFTELPAKINNGHTTSCGCARMSSRERLIDQVLKNNQIEFETQYTFDDCIDKYKLRFDFAIFHNKKLVCLIEYDGRQHFQPVDVFGGEFGFHQLQRKDNIKNDYCRDNNIDLYRIPYTLTDNEIITKITNIIYPYRLQDTNSNINVEVV